MNHKKTYGQNAQYYIAYNISYKGLAIICTQQIRVQATLRLL